MNELFVDCADQLDRNYVEPVREERHLTGFLVFCLKEPRDPFKMLGSGNRLRGRWKHVAVEGLSKPLKQAFGGRAVTQYFGQIAMTAQLHQALVGNDLPVDQVLREDGTADQALCLLAIEINVDEFVFEFADVAQQTAIDTRFSMDALLLLPELAGFHG